MFDPSHSPPSPIVRLSTWFVCRAGRHDDERGQATTEYALVLLAAALIALLVVAWATAGGGAGKVGHLFDKVIDTVIDKL